MRPSVGILLGLALAFPGIAPAATPVEEQRSAILDCKRQEGISGVAYIQQRRSTVSVDGTMQAAIVPYDQVTALNADAINSCAASRLGLNTAEFAAFNSRNRTIVRSQRAPAGYRQGCGRNPSILYRGDLYCQWARR